MRRTRQVSGTGAVPPDERDMRLGRERPDPTGPWGEEGGIAEGGRSRPRRLFVAADRRADCDTGGTERRPVPQSEVAHCERRQASRDPSDQGSRPPSDGEPLAGEGGTMLPRLRSPLPSSLSGILRGVQGARTRVVNSLGLTPDASSGFVRERDVNVRAMAPKVLERPSPKAASLCNQKLACWSS